jgi:alkylation response protein AidB-like acyl-CoA dehydrogenase
LGQATLKTPAKSCSFLFANEHPGEIFTKEDISEEQQLFARTAEQFMREEVVPKAEQLYEKDWELTRRLLRQAGSLDLLRADVPEQYGGLGLDKVSSALISEQMALNASFAATVSAHTGIGTLPIVFFGTPEQRAKYLPRIASGEMVSAFCLTEPGSGSDALAARTKATLSSDGKHYILSGQKMWITNGGLADVFIVFAKVDGEKFTGFIVERGPGVTSGHNERKLGLDGSSTTAITLEDCRVPVENVLGQVGKGHVVAFNSLNFGRLKLGNRNIGLAKIALNHAIAYANERHQFGRPISSFGLIKRKLAEMAVRCYVGDAVTFRTVGMVDRALEAVDQGDPMQTMKVIEQFAVECSIIKVWTSEALGYVADEALQTYGGYGYSKDYPAERIVRDARITRIYEGTNEINRMLITTRLLKNAADGIEAALEGLANNGNGTSNSLLENMVAEGKRTATASLRAITRRFGNELKEQQEVLALVADILIDLYTTESVWLRTEKLKTIQSEEKSSVQRDMATLYAYDAFNRIAVGARNLAGALAGRNTDGQVWECAQRLATQVPIDTVALRQNVADTLISAGRFIW